MGTTNFLFTSVTRWCKKFKSGEDSVEDAPHARRPKTATSQKTVEKVTNLVATDARLTFKHTAKCVGISVGATHTILRHDLKQKLARVRIAKQLLKRFSKYNNRSFANIITGDETWFTFTSPSERYKTKYGQPKKANDLAWQNAP